MIKNEDFNFSQLELEYLYWSQYWSLKNETEAKNLSFLPSLFRKNHSNLEKEMKIKRLKAQWLSEWHDGTRKLLNINNQHSINDIKDFLVGNNMSEGKLLAFIVEYSSFTPYFPLSKDDEEYKSLKFQSEIYLETMKNIIPTYGRKFFDCRDLFLSAQKEISKEVSGSSNIFLWVSLAAVASLLIAPYLGAAIGGMMGLSGAAATNAGLAFLGFGSIAAGGLGMAGGTVAVMAGGSLIAYKSGDSVYKNKIMELSGESLLISCSKLAAVTCLIKEKKETFNYLCMSTRILQNDFEKETDELFIARDLRNGEEFEKKALTLGAFRKFIREL